MWLSFKRLALNVWVVCLLHSHCALQCASLSLQGALSLRFTGWMWMLYVVGNLGFS